MTAPSQVGQNLPLAHHPLISRKRPLNGPTGDRLANSSRPGHHGLETLTRTPAVFSSKLFSWFAFLSLAMGTPIARAIATVPAINRDDSTWIGTWGAAPQPAMPGTLESFRNQSVRLIVHTSIGGKRVRIKVANTFGDTPLVIGAAHIARRTHGANVDRASDRLLMFGGRPSVVVPPRAMVASDPVDLEFPPLADLAISLFFPAATSGTTVHSLALQTNYLAPATGNITGVELFPVAKTLDSWPFLAGVDVEASPRGSVVVAFGDSTIDGDGSTSDANRRLSDVLAERLQAAHNLETGVLNEGVIGNRLLRGSPTKSRKQFGYALGQAGLVRFDRDVLDQAGVRYVIVRIGINDIGFPGTFASLTEKVSFQDMISGYRQLIVRARERGIRIIGTTLSPFEDAKAAPGYFTPEKETLRQEINTWIRSAGEFDGIIDVDKVLRDPSHPARLLGAYDSGDHLHPNDAGYVATGYSIPLTLLTGD